MSHAQALRAHGDLCLNCNGTDHSQKACSKSFLTTSGILNPALGQLNDDGQAYRQWQQRMLSYRRGQYERNLERSSNRYDNNRRGNNTNRSGNSNNSRSNYNHSRNYRGDNGRSNNWRHSNGRNYDNGNRHSPGQQFRQQRIEPAPSSSALTVHTPATNTSAPAAPANMRMGSNNSTTHPNQRQPGTFRTN